MVILIVWPYDFTHCLCRFLMVDSFFIHWWLCSMAFNLLWTWLSLLNYFSFKTIFQLIERMHITYCCWFLSHFLQGPEVRSGDLPRPIKLVKGQEFTFTTKRGVSSESCVSVNYDDFVNDVEDGDIILVDGIFCLY